MVNRFLAVCTALVPALLTASLLLSSPVLASAGAGLAPAAAPVPAPALSAEYSLFRNVALGLGAVGFVVGLAGMALNRDHPESYLQWRRALLLCTAVFLLAALDRTVGRGIAGIMGYDTSGLWE